MSEKTDEYLQRIHRLVEDHYVKPVNSDRWHLFLDDINLSKPVRVRFMAANHIVIEDNYRLTQVDVCLKRDEDSRKLLTVTVHSNKFSMGFAPGQPVDDSSIENTLEFAHHSLAVALPQINRHKLGQLLARMA